MIEKDGRSLLTNPKMRHHPDERPRVKAESLRLAATLGLNHHEFQRVVRFVETYLPLDDAEEIEYNRIKEEEWTMAEQNILDTIVSPWERKVMDKGRAEGVQQGHSEGLRQIIALQVEEVFGDFPEVDRKLLSMLPVDCLQQLAIAIVKSKSYDQWRDQLNELVPSSSKTH